MADTGVRFKSRSGSRGALSRSPGPSGVTGGVIRPFPWPGQAGGRHDGPDAPGKPAAAPFRRLPPDPSGSVPMQTPSRRRDRPRAGCRRGPPGARIRTIPIRFHTGPAHGTAAGKNAAAFSALPSLQGRRLRQKRSTSGFEGSGIRIAYPNMRDSPHHVNWTPPALSDTNAGDQSLTGHANLDRPPYLTYSFCSKAFNSGIGIIFNSSESSRWHADGMPIWLIPPPSVPIRSAKPWTKSCQTKLGRVRNSRSSASTSVQK